MTHDQAEQPNFDALIADKFAELSDLFRQRSEQRAAAVLLASAWMTARELGVQLGCSEDTVRKRAIDGAEVLPGQRVIARRASARNTRFALQQLPESAEPRELEYQRRERLLRIAS